MENPLDSAGELVKGAGEQGANFLFGIARFLEQITGDAVSAAIFAGFLIFALSLIKGAGLSRNSSVYSQAITKLGIIGVVGYLVFSAILAISYSSERSEADLVLQGLRGEKTGAVNGFSGSFVSTFWENKWYLVIFVVMTLVGFILSGITKKIPSKIAD